MPRRSWPASVVAAAAVAAALAFELELAPQQAAWIIRHALQPLLDRLLLFIVRLAVLSCAQAQRPLLLLLAFLQRLIHRLLELLLRLLLGGFRFGLRGHLAGVGLVVVGPGLRGRGLLVALAFAGLECGVVLADTNDIKPGDMLEVFEVEERERTL